MKTLRFEQHPDVEIVDIVKAAPGYYVLECWDDADTLADVIRQPVIAWGLDRYNLMPYPILEDGLRNDASYMQHPHGAVSRPNGEWFQSIEVAFQQRQEAKPRAGKRRNDDR